MSTSYDRENGYDDLHSADTEREREISLGTGTILGIFLGLALVCAIFFGFGFTIGRRSAAPAAASIPASAAASEPAFVPTSTGGGKPSPGSLQTGAMASRSGASANPEADETPVTTVQPPAPRAATAASPSRTEFHPPAVVVPPATGAATAAAAPAPGAPSYVQIAAVSHREDADLLLSALSKRGYAAAIRPGTQDQLLHIQVGPLATKKEADAMRQRLLADGYNAIVK